MLIPLIIFIFYNVKIVFKKWEIKSCCCCCCCCCCCSESAMGNMDLDLEMKTESGLLNFVLSTASSLAELYFSIRKSIK